MSLRIDRPTSACPFIDLNDQRCDCRFTLGRLSDVFGLCLDGYRRCATYPRLAHEHRELLSKTTTHAPALQPTGT